MRAISLSVLDRAHALDRAGAGNELPSGRQQLAQTRVLGDREVGVVESQASRACARGEQRRDGGVEQLSGDDLAGEQLGDLFGGLCLVTEVGEEAVLAGVPAGGDQHQRVAAGEAGEVADVDGAPHEQRVELALAQLGCEALHARNVGELVRGARDARHRASPWSRCARSCVSACG